MTVEERLGRIEAVAAWDCLAATAACLVFGGRVCAVGGPFGFYLPPVVPPWPNRSP